MKLVLVLTVLLVRLCSAGFAQPAPYRAYHVSGQVFLKSKTGTVPLRPQATVSAGEGLVLKRGAQVVLIDEQGGNISYTKPGTVGFTELQKAFQINQTSTGRAYLAYVYAAMQKKANTPPKQANAPLGGVARGNITPLLAPADSAVLEQSTVAFRWQPAPADTVSWFTLTDASGDPLLQLSTKAAGLQLNTLLTRLQPNTLYYWKVAARPEDAANAPRRAFILADVESLDLFKQELAGVPVAPEAAGWQRRFRAAWFFGRAKAR